MYAPQTVHNQSIAGVLMKVLLALHLEQTLILLISLIAAAMMQFKCLDIPQKTH